MKEKQQQRTQRQNNALHLLFTQLADELNLNGFDMRKTLKPEIDIPWTGETVKAYLWKPVQKAQLKKQSTTELTTKEIDEVFDTLNRHLGIKFGLHIPFPSIDEIIYRQEAKDNERKAPGVGRKEIEEKVEDPDEPTEKEINSLMKRQK